MYFSGVLILLSPVAMVVGCDLLDVTGAVLDLLLDMGDISYRVTFLFFIDSLSIVVVIFSIIVLFCAFFCLH